MNTLIAIIRLILMTLVLSSLYTHTRLWQCVDRKLDRTPPIATVNEKLAAMVAWGSGVLGGIYLWRKMGIGLRGTLLYDPGWSVAGWLGGMMALSLVELLILWREQRKTG